MAADRSPDRVHHPNIRICHRLFLLFDIQVVDFAFNLRLNDGLSLSLALAESFPEKGLFPHETGSGIDRVCNDRNRLGRSSSAALAGMSRLVPADSVLGSRFASGMIPGDSGISGVLEADAGIDADRALFELCHAMPRRRQNCFFLR